MMPGPQSAFDNAGSAARVTGDLFWLFVIPLTVIFLIVVGIAVMSIFRRHRGIEQEPLEGTHRPSAQTERRLTRAVTGAGVLTLVILLGLIVVSVSAGKAISAHAMPSNAITVEVSATQWWWDIHYVNDNASLILTTANEIHVPVGRPVLIRGVSQDVIHSFWVPSLIGKRDLIPSRVTTAWFTAEREGRFRGQCAEFCGLQHAHMALWVVAESPEKFNQWMKAQLEDAANPATASEQTGEKVFLNRGCALCHTIRGANVDGLIAEGQVAPDLTHLASRITIAAGTLPNNRGNLGGWITDPQSIKPGNHMATIPLTAPELNALLDYLGILK
jgi:cytochrome c oxidase subunit 2